MNKDHIIFLIGRINYKANRLLQEELEKHGIRGLAPSHGEILGSLLLHGEVQMTKLTEYIDKDKSTITALVNKLVRLGYVKKRKDTSDNRVTWIGLTDRGAALKPDIMEISRTLRKRAYENISDREKDTLAALLMKINSGM
ncbi:MAG TPA: MarR family transcriptional regulator [Spirochaetota bacterium]|nr:MarR family transcriptional regulator [Spirochaetota bacterium]HPV42976.1 MarR family transcriptional regulator [Spirochaetota bacterium]